MRSELLLLIYDHVGISALNCSKPMQLVLCKLLIICMYFVCVSTNKIVLVQHLSSEIIENLKLLHYHLCQWLFFCFCRNCNVFRKLDNFKQSSIIVLYIQQYVLLSWIIYHVHTDLVCRDSYNSIVVTELLLAFS